MSEEKYKNLYNNAQVGLATTSISDGKMIECNNKLAQMLGFDSRQRCIDEYIASEHYVDPNSRKCLIDELTKNGQITNFEAQLTRCDGVPIWISSAAQIYPEKGYLESVVIDITERKKEEEAIRQERDRAQKYLDVAGVMFVALDEKGEVTLINRKGYELLGYEQDQIVGRNWFDNFIPQTINEDVKTVYINLMTGQTELVEYYENPVLTRDGKERIIAWHNTVLKDDKGNIVGTLSSGEDITERKQAAEALSQSEEKYRSLIQHIPGVVWTTDECGNTTFISPAVEKIYGYIPDEIYQQADQLWFGRIHPDDLDNVKKAFANVFEKEEQLDIEYRIKRKDGQWIWLNDRSIGAYEIDSVKYADGVFFDITEKKKAEQDLKKSEERLELALRGADLGLFDSDIVTGDIIRNRRTAEIYGYKSVEQMKPTINMWKSSIHPDDKAEVIKKRDAHLEGRTELYEAEYRLRTKSGNYKWISSRSKIVERDKDGKPLRITGTLLDITEKKKAEQELQRYQQQLKSLASELSVVEERERRRIAAGLHDDVAQKLALAKLETQLLMPSITNEQNLAAMKKHCDLVDSILKDVRFLTFELSNPILYEVGLDAAIEDWLTDHIQKKFGIKCKFISDIQKNDIDQSTSIVLFQAVRELLANVIKHANAKKITVSIKTHNNTLRISVKDDGIGFEYPESVVKTQTMGGFGLFNIRERVEQLAGQFVIKAKPGKGTQATITVPMTNKVMS